MPQASHSAMATKILPPPPPPPLLRSYSLGQICTPHLLIIPTKPVCHHNSFWGSRCDSNHATTISLKPRTLSRRFRQFFPAYDTFLVKAHLITTSDHPRYFESFQPYFLLNHLISANPYQTNLSRLPNKPFQATNPKISKTNQNVQMFSTTLTMIHRESNFNVKDVRGWQFLTMKAAETLCIVCLPPEKHIS